MRKIMSLFQKILISLLCITLAASPVTAMASADNPVDNVGEQEPIKLRRVFWSGTAYVSDTAYTNITSSNNLFDDNPKVTNSAGNAGKLSFRIVDKDGEPIGSVKVCIDGYSVTMDTVPFNSGTYTLQAKADSGKAGSYYITID